MHMPCRGGHGICHQECATQMLPAPRTGPPYCHQTACQSLSVLFFFTLPCSERRRPALLQQLVMLMLVLLGIPKWLCFSVTEFDIVNLS